MCTVGTSPWQYGRQTMCRRNVRTAWMLTVVLNLHWCTNHKITNWSINVRSCEACVAMSRSQCIHSMLCIRMMDTYDGTILENGLRISSKQLLSSIWGTSYNACWLSLSATLSEWLGNNFLFPLQSPSFTRKPEIPKKPAFSCIFDTCPAYIFVSLPLYVRFFFFTFFINPYMSFFIPIMFLYVIVFSYICIHIYILIYIYIYMCIYFYYF